MPDIAERYQMEDGHRLIEINLTTIQQLFNSFDPSPFHEKDLDADAEDYIVGAAREFHVSSPLKLVLHLPADEAMQARSSNLASSIHGYFAYRGEGARRDLRFLLRQGRLSLAVGLSFLALCLAMRALFFLHATTTLDLVASEGLVIIGWVAMWRPVEIFLYEWWPLRRRARVYDKLAAVPVDIRTPASR